jgi:hypothetical protein
MRRVFSDLPGWSFEIDEVSAGVYEVIATDKHGRRFSDKDTDPDALLEKCPATSERVSEERALPVLRNLMTRLSPSDAPSAPYEREKMKGIVATLIG